MNTPLRRVSLAMMVMIVLLLANDMYVQVVKADSYRANPNNQRVLDDEYSRPRGVIVTGFVTMTGLAGGFVVMPGPP